MVNIEQLVGITKDDRFVDFSNIKAIAMVASDSDDTVLIDLEKGTVERKRQHLNDNLLGDENDKALAANNYEVEFIVRMTSPKLLEWMRVFRTGKANAAWNPTELELIRMASG